MSALCNRNGDFNKYFEQNMKAMGVTVPGLFDTYQLAVGTAATMVGSLQLLGKGATVGELIGATVGLEKLVVASAFGAAFYTGVIVGSLFVASARSATCGGQLSDLFVFIEQNNLEFNGWRSFYTKNPEILDKNYKFRRFLALKGKNSPLDFEYA